MYNLVLYQSYLVKGMTMQKTAQKMRWRDTVRETLDPAGGLEEYFDPEFKDIMEHLRQVDNQVRAQILGKEVGNVSPVDADGNALMADNIPSMKELLKSASSNLDNYEYMKVVVDISRFDERMASVSQMLEQLDAKMDKVQLRFLFDDDNEEYSGQLRSLREKFEKQQKAKEVSSSRKYELVVEAGFIDFFKNIGNDRRKALYHWEQRYPKRVKILKGDTKKLIFKANSLFDQVLKTLKAMSAARAAREVDKYNEISAKIISGYKSFHEYFVQYYDKNVRKFLEKYWADSKEMKSSEMAEQEVEPEKKEEISTPATVPGMPAEMAGTPGGFIMGEGLPPAQYTDKSLAPGGNSPIPTPPIQRPSAPSAAPNVAPVPGQNITPTVPMSTTETIQRQVPVEPSMVEDPELRALLAGGAKEPVIERLRRRRQHQPIDVPAGQVSFKPGEFGARPLSPPGRVVAEFINTLQSMSNESPIILKNYINKYASTIKLSNPDTYKKLMVIVNAIEV